MRVPSGHLTLARRTPPRPPAPLEGERLSRTGEHVRVARDQLERARAHLEQARKRFQRAKDRDRG